MYVRLANQTKQTQTRPPIGAASLREGLGAYFTCASQALRAAVRPELQLLALHEAGTLIV